MNWNLYFFLWSLPLLSFSLLLSLLMSKRVATYQISDRNPVDPSDEDDGIDNEEYFNSSETENGRAKEEELRQRKYRKTLYVLTLTYLIIL